MPIDANRKEVHIYNHAHSRKVNTGAIGYLPLRLYFQHS